MFNQQTPRILSCLAVAGFLIAITSGVASAGSCCGPRASAPPQSAQPACGPAGHDHAGHAGHAGGDAHDGHATAAGGELHGGQATSTAGHVFETVFVPEGIRIYRYTETGAPQSIAVAKGQAEVRLPDGSKRKVKLEPGTLEARPVWICPMDPDVAEHEPGDCPECGMSLAAHDHLLARMDLSEFAGREIIVAVRLENLGGSQKKASFIARGTTEKRTIAAGSGAASGPPAQADEHEGHAH